MKTINLVLIALSLTLFTNLSFANAKKDMKELASKVELVEYGSLPEGYTKKEVKLPVLGKRLKKIFADLAHESYEIFEEVIYSYWQEENFLTEEEAKDALKNPTQYLGVNYLIEAYATFKIYKDGKFIGYVIAADDNARAEQIQDGSWMEIFITKYHKLIDVKRHDA